MVIVYDTTEKKSFKDVEVWLNNLRRLIQKDVEVFLVGSKIDLKKERVIAKRLGMQFANKNLIHFQEVSATDIVSTDSLLNKITSYALKENTSMMDYKDVSEKEHGCVRCLIL